MLFLLVNYCYLYQKYDSNSTVINITHHMKKLTVLLSCLLSLHAWGQESSFQQDFAGMIEFNSGRVLALAEAIPAETYEWSPQEGVRTTESVILHIASANYFLPMIAGGELPEGINPQELEKTISGKENVIEALKKSYDFLIEFGKNIKEEELGVEVKFPDGNMYTKRAVMMIAISHAYEHQGQMIAYARMNKITPPWSKKEE